VKRVFDSFFSAKDGLTSDHAVPVLPDRDGNLWIGSVSGLDSFRRSNVNTVVGIAVGPGTHVALAMDSGRSVWIAYGDKLFAVEGGAFRLLARNLVIRFGGSFGMAAERGGFVPFRRWPH
jgi:ligand-binding sensor domain-containing protein